MSPASAPVPAPHAAAPSFRYGAEIDLPAPADLVWRIVADYARDAEWREGVVVRPEPAGLARDGTRTFEALRLLGDTHRVTARVCDVADGRSLRFVSEDHRVAGHRRVAPTDAGARFELDVAVSVDGGMAPLAPLLGRHFHRRVRRDLARLRRVVRDEARWQALGLDAPTRTAVVPTSVGPLSVTRIGDGGPAALLWHSAFLDGRSWWPLLPAIAPGRTLLVVDGPGHGRSPGPAQRFSLDDCADAVLEVMDHHGVAEADVIGHAWGGHVAAALAARGTHRVRRVALVSSPLDALRGAARLQARVAAALVRVAGVRAVRSVLLDTLLAPSTRATRPELVDYVVEAASLPGRARTARAMRSIVIGRPSLVERLPSIAAPTLVVATDDDPTWPVDVAAREAARLPRGRFEVVAGARHVPLLEATDATAALLADWLR